MSVCVFIPVTERMEADVRPRVQLIAFFVSAATSRLPRHRRLCPIKQHEHMPQWAQPPHSSAIVQYYGEKGDLTQ